MKVFQIFLIFIQFGYKYCADVKKMYIAIVSFVKIGAVKAINFLGV